MIFKRKILFFATIIFGQLVFAQGSTTIKATVDKNTILLGQPIHLTIEANLSPASSLMLNSLDSIAHFEFIEKPLIDTIKGNIRGVYKITSFDSGKWVIPAFALASSVSTDSIPIDVVFSDFDPNQAYHDIKDILLIKPINKKKNWWWYVAGAVFFLVLLLLYIQQKKKTLPPGVPKIVISPFEEAMEGLKKLEKDIPGIKQYYSRLTDIFRLYVYRKKGIHSMQKTTEEIIGQLRNLNLSKAETETLSYSLRLSDFVKFARYNPTEDDNSKIFDAIRNAIILIEKAASNSSNLSEIK